jgi:hypothetical protein
VPRLPQRPGDVGVAPLSSSSPARGDAGVAGAPAARGGGDASRGCDMQKKMQQKKERKRHWFGK